MYIRVLFLAMITFATTVPSFAQTCNSNITATTGHLIGNADGTVSDNKTKLMWKRCPEGFSYSNGTCSSSGTTSYTWNAALATPATANSGLGFANKTNWRLPNIKEIQSIVEEKCQLPALNQSVFPNTTVTTPATKWIWSNSPATANSANTAWHITFDYGNMEYSSIASSYGVRLVRDCPECN